MFQVIWNLWKQCSKLLLFYCSVSFGCFINICFLLQQEFIDAQAKKTDEQSPDDESKAEQKTSDEKSDKVGTGGDAPVKKSKADLEVEEVN